MRALAIVLVLLASCRKEPAPERAPAAGAQVTAGATAPAATSAPGPVAAATPAEDRAATRMAQTLELVRLGYGDLHGLEVRSLEFRTEELTTRELQQVLALVPDYNAFSGPRIARAIESLRGEISSYSFGREGSPVLYVKLPYWESQKEGSLGVGAQGNRKLTEQEHQALVTRVKKVFAELGADEVELGASDHELRFWWD